MTDQRRFVSRGGDKLDAALTAFGLDVRGWVCADFGSHTGGFVDCLLARGARLVYAVDPGHGVLHERLRSDPRVVVCERTNALRFVCPQPCDLVTVDVGWTPQRLILPAVRRNLRPDGCAVVLVKPHYEAPRQWLRRGVLRSEYLLRVLAQVREDVTDLGWRIAAEIESPLTGTGGNREYLWLLRR